jgi:hypothetical protein
VLLTLALIHPINYLDETNYQYLLVGKDKLNIKKQINPKLKTLRSEKKPTSQMEKVREEFPNAFM